MPGDFGLRHAGIMFERQRGDGVVALAAAAYPEKTDHRADILATVRQRGDFLARCRNRLAGCGWSRAVGHDDV